MLKMSQRIRSTLLTLISACPFAKILSGLNAFDISNLQEQETESGYPGDRDVTMLHGAEKLLYGVFADHNLYFARRILGIPEKRNPSKRAKSGPYKSEDATYQGRKNYASGLEVPRSYEQ